MTNEYYRNVLEAVKDTEVEMSWEFIDGFKAEYKRTDVDNGGNCDITADLYCMGWYL